MYRAAGLFPRSFGAGILLLLSTPWFTDSRSEVLNVFFFPKHSSEFKLSMFRLVLLTAVEFLLLESHGGCELDTTLLVLGHSFVRRLEEFVAQNNVCSIVFHGIQIGLRTVDKIIRDNLNKIRCASPKICCPRAWFK